MQNDNVSVTGILGLLHNIKKTFQGEPHPLEEIRRSLSVDQNKNKDFIDILESHHAYLGESISTLIDDEASTSEKQIHLTRLIHLLKMHARAEEETLYQHLFQVSDKDARRQGFAGRIEHDIILAQAKELAQVNFEKNWSEEIEAKAKVMAQILRNHMEEEENEMFPLVQNALELEMLEELKIPYLEKCKAYLETEPSSPPQ